MYCITYSWLPYQWFSQKNNNNNPGFTQQTAQKTVQVEFIHHSRLKCG